MRTNLISIDDQNNQMSPLKGPGQIMDTLQFDETGRPILNQNVQGQLNEVGSVEGGGQVMAEETMIAFSNDGEEEDDVQVLQRATSQGDLKSIVSGGG